LALGATDGRCRQRIAEQVGQFVLVVVEFIDIRLALAHEINGQGECTGRIHLVIEIQMAMNRARFQDLGLQGNADRDQLFFFHDPILYEQWFSRSFTNTGPHDGGSAHAIVFRRHAADHPKSAAPCRSLRRGIRRIVRRQWWSFRTRRARNICTTHG
jgi:hypothetical protein